jgi:hypothetical protein
LIRSPVEPGFHRIGRGRDLTERQGHGEDFDENCFHCPDWVVPRVALGQLVATYFVPQRVASCLVRLDRREGMR